MNKKTILLALSLLAMEATDAYSQEMNIAPYFRKKQTVQQDYSDHPYQHVPLESLINLGYDEISKVDKILNTGALWQDETLPKGYGRITSVDLARTVNSITLTERSGHQTVLNKKSWLSYISVDNYAGEGFRVEIKYIPTGHSFAEGDMNTEIDQKNANHRIYLKDGSNGFTIDYVITTPDFDIIKKEKNMQVSENSRRKLKTVYDEALRMTKSILTNNFRIQHN